MGLATAKAVGQDHHVVVCDWDQKRLKKAVGELKQLGISCDSFVLDITDPTSVDAVIKYAFGQGKLVSVIHTAGLSPQMGDPETIMKVNALGTVNITNTCCEVAREGFALINVASMAAHLFPCFLLPKRAYPFALTDAEVCLKKALFLYRFMPTKLYRNGMAYGISKDFVVWLSRKSAARFGEKGTRILSVSPGTFDTEMGHLEEKSGSAKMLKTAALKRFGKPGEMADCWPFAPVKRPVI